MVFFLDAQGRTYARYGGRDAEGPDSRQSPSGLKCTMESVLQMHGRAQKSFAPRQREPKRFVRDVPGLAWRGRCIHCHQVKEALNADLRKRGVWERDLAFRYPLPENVGLELEVDRGNVVKAVKAKSPAAEAGLAKGDVVRRLGEVPIHSFADVQYALDIAPRTGAIEIAWLHDGEEHTGKLALAPGWRVSDVSWRPSMQRWVPWAWLYGPDLKAAEKKALGLAPGRLAFRQRDALSAQAKAAGIQGGDIVIGLDGKALEMDVDEFLRYVNRSYLVGDTVTVNVIRDGKRVDLAMRLLP